MPRLRPGRPRRLPDARQELTRAQARFDTVADQAKQSLDGFREGLGLPKRAPAGPPGGDAEFLTLLD